MNEKLRSVLFVTALTFVACLLPFQAEADPGSYINPFNNYNRRLKGKSRIQLTTSRGLFSMLGFKVARGLLAVAAVAVLAGAAWGWEWSDNIRVTNHADAILSHRHLSVKSDAEGNFHLLYFLDSVDDSLGVCYAKCDRDGQMLISPMLVFPEFHPDYWEFGAMCVDEDCHPHILVRDEDYYHAILDDNGGYIQEPTVVPGLAYPWYGGFNLRPTQDAEIHLEMTSEGNYVLECADMISYDDKIYAITYTRLNTDFELIDSTHVVYWSDDPRARVYGPTKFYVDSRDNLYFAWRVIRPVGDGGNEGRFAMVAANDSIIAANYRVPHHRQYVGASHLAAPASDSHGNVYLMVSELAEDELAVVQKMNAEMEILANTEMGYSEGFSNERDAIACARDTIYAVQVAIREGFEENCFLMTMDTTGSRIDSLEAIAPGVASVLNLSLTDNGINIFFIDYRGGVDHRTNIWMIHSVSESGVPKLITPRSGNYVKIFPNPVNSSSSIQFFINQPGEVQFELFLIDGRLVARRSGYFSAGEHSLSLEFFNRDLSRLPSGSFILKTKLPGISHPQANLYHLIH